MSIAIHSRVVGRGRTNVVFLHGVFGQGKNFTDIASAIGDIATSRLIDLPNHGRSAWTTTFDQDDTVDRVTAHLIDHGALAKPLTLIGHSLGGKIAMRLALNYPRLIERLVVVDISPVNGGTARVFGPWIEAMLDLDLETLSSRNEASDLLKPFIPDDRVRSFLLSNLHRENQTWSWRANLELIRDNLDVVSDWPDVHRPPYQGPVLWIAGAESPYITDEHSEAMTSLFPHTEKVTIDGAGHWVHADAPGAFVAALREFLSQPTQR